MVLFGQLTTNMSSPAVQVAMLAVVGVVIFVAVKIGGVILKLLLGLAAIACVWWVVAKNQFTNFSLGFALCCRTVVSNLLYRSFPVKLSPMKEKSVSTRRLTKPAQGARVEFPVASVRHSFPVIAMAASVGGLKALSIILGGCRRFSGGHCHRDAHCSRSQKSAGRDSEMPHASASHEAHTGDVLVPSKVFVAPPNHHLFVVKAIA